MRFIERLTRLAAVWEPGRHHSIGDPAKGRRRHTKLIELPFLGRARAGWVVFVNFAQEVMTQLDGPTDNGLDINDLAGVPFDKIESAIAEIRRREAEGLIRRCPPRFRTVRVYTRGWYDLSEAPQG